MSKHISKVKKKKIVKMYLQGESPKSLCEYYSIPKSTLYTWIYQFPEKRRNSKYLAPSTEYSNLVKRATKLEHEREILQSFIAGLDLTQETKYGFMDEIYGQYNIHEICNAMQVNRGTYYNHLKAKDSLVQTMKSGACLLRKHLNTPHNLGLGTRRKISACTAEPPFEPKCTHKHSKEADRMLSSKFGIEIEFTGISRSEAADVVSKYLEGSISRSYDYYDTYTVTAPDGRNWKLMYDGSLHCRRRVGRSSTSAGSEYSCELVSPILIYREDIGTLQDIVRRLRKAGGMTNNSCGIHIHLDGAAHTPRSIRNFINLIASRNDLFYKALQIEPERMGYCKKMDAYLVKRMNEKKPRTFSQLEEIWYAGYGGNRNGHYHDSRYHFLNLHCFFHGNHTIELRGFNSELHAGKIRAYIVFALAMNHQALTQKSASYRKVQEENEKFAMRVYLNRIGFIGEEFKSCRKHLYEHLDGNAAWRYGSKENCRSRRKKPKNVVDEEEASLNESESDDLDYLCDPNADLPFD